MNSTALSAVGAEVTACLPHRFSRVLSPLLRGLLAAAVLRAAAPAVAADEVTELREMVKALQQTVAAQNARIDQLEKRVAEQRSAGAGGNANATILATPILGDPAALPKGLAPSSPSPLRDADTFADLQNAAPRADNQSLDPKLKGFVAIPGTDTAFKIGGSARIDAIADSGNNGNPNQFIPSSIPVPGEPGAGGGRRSTIHAKGTRLSLEFRRPVGDDESLRIFTEYDFFDDSTSSAMKLRARHFYGQAWNLLIGQTYSAFMDIDAFPDVVDYQGPNAILNRRQPQIRYTLPLRRGEGAQLKLFASLEQSDPKLDLGAGEVDASLLTQMPDAVLGLRWEGKPGHLQAAALFRELAYESDGRPSGETFGWGLGLSGSVNLFEKDKLSWQTTYGEGIGRYINDLSGENLDAALVGSGLDAVPVWAAMAGYTHHWGPKWRSTVTGGYVSVDAPGALGSFALESTLYGSLNLMWHPTASFRMGLEYLYGSRETTGGADADGHRLNFVVRYDLVH